MHGMHLARWLERRRERLEAVGVVPLPGKQTEHAKSPKTAVSAFEKGAAAPP
ncbi:hypothetical protein AB0I94_32620 [Streptomyces sp. NPDC050147]|uniref:hypothetical protein n=1 Tax=Streptomyces sp. NPDC050147 TaxID=3155513 RepID=UPI003418BF1B